MERSTAFVASNGTIVAQDMSHTEFLDRYARAGCIGLSGGTSLVDKAIASAERHLDEKRRWSPWTHAFLCQGRRIDGHQWIIESNIDVSPHHVRVGIQENRISKFSEENGYTTLAILDFGLTEEQTKAVLSEALELVSGQVRYSLIELIGTVIALRNPASRKRKNSLGQAHAFYCSALVHYIFQKAGIDLAPGVDSKHSTPADIARSTLPHTTYLLPGVVAHSDTVRVLRRIRTRVKATLRRLRQDEDEAIEAEEALKPAVAPIRDSPQPTAIAPLPGAATGVGGLIVP